MRIDSQCRELAGSVARFGPSRRSGMCRRARWLAPCCAPCVISWTGMFTSIFLVTLAAIVVLTLVGTVIRQRQKDSCLRLFHDHHVSYLTAAGTVLWGDLAVYSQGLAIRCAG